MARPTILLALMLMVTSEPFLFRRGAEAGYAPGAERSRLYSPPDPACKGGIAGTVAKPAEPIEQILAVPPDEPRLAYEGKLSDPDRRQFRFDGLPMRKYDLIVITGKALYEGLELHRGESTLTPEDRRQITEIVEASEPFFTRKVIHRLEGSTGDGNVSRCFCTFLRDRPSDGGAGYRRTFKICMLKDVGPGWQMVRTRDLYPTYVEPDRGLPPHRFSQALKGIRVTDYLKDLGEMDVTK